MTGIDLDDANLRFAREHYSHPRIKYVNVDVTKLIDLGERFDVAVAYEIIEHLPPDKADDFVKGLVECLHPGGIALISTPNHAVVAASGVSVPDFHINNLTSKEFKKSLEKHFDEVTMLGQIKSKGPLKNLIYAMDVLHLRHIKILRKRPTPNTNTESPKQEEYPFFWRPEQGWGESSKFIFSPLLWRQAGQSMAVCRRR